MSEIEGCGGCCGCGCVSFIVSSILFLFLIWALWFGLPVGRNKWNINVFPPRIWDMNDAGDEKEEPEEKKQPDNKQEKKGEK